MDNFSNVIGYSGVKKELEMILDVLVNKEKYRYLGVNTPSALMLEGIPGVGKSLFAKTLIEKANRKTYTIRKNKSDGGFVDSIRNTFEEAAKNGPSIVFLDDMDKFSNGDEYHINTDEMVTIQSCIDNCKGKEVFVVATCNDMDCIPDSLLRHGRFDKIIHVRAPEYEDSVAIISHYLKQKRYSNEVDCSVLAKLLRGKSCATLETVINEAGIYAAYNNRNEINMDDVVKSILRIIYGGVECEAQSDEYRMSVATHEIGHALISELLSPGSVDFVSMKEHESNSGGFTLTYSGPKADFDTFEKDVYISLAGKAAIEVILGQIDIGSNSDLHKAFSIVEKIVDNHCAYGFSSFLKRDSGTIVTNEREKAIDYEISRYYFKTKQMIINNRKLFDRMVKELLAKDYLTAADIKKIKKEEGYAL